MTLQEIFDTVKRHLLAMGRPAIEKGACRYRAGKDSCAVGCLIANAYYHYTLEGKSAWDQSVFYALQNSGVVPADMAYTPYTGSVSYKLLNRLQDLHDQTSESDWAVGLIEVAKEFGLDCIWEPVEV